MFGLSTDLIWAAAVAHALDSHQYHMRDSHVAGPLGRDEFDYPELSCVVSKQFHTASVPNAYMRWCHSCFTGNTGDECWWCGAATKREHLAHTFGSRGSIHDTNLGYEESRSREYDWGYDESDADTSGTPNATD